MVSTKDVSDLLSLKPESMVKTVIFKSLIDDKFFVALIPPIQRVDVKQLAKAEKLDKKEIMLALPDEVERKFGFPIGGVPPLGFQESVNVQVYVDPAIRKSSERFLYMGVGDNTKTLRLAKNALLRIIEEYVDLPLTFESNAESRR